MSLICLHLVILYNIDHIHLTRIIFLFLKTACMDTIRLIVFKIPATTWLQAIFRHTGECCKHSICIYDISHNGIPWCFTSNTFYCILLLFMAYVCHVTASLCYVKPLPFSFYWFVYQDFISYIQKSLFFSVLLSQTTDHGRTHYNECHGESNHSTVYSNICLGQHQSKHQSPCCWPFICEGKPLVTCGFPHKGPVMRKPFP